MDMVVIVFIIGEEAGWYCTKSRGVVVTLMVVDGRSWADVAILFESWEFGSSIGMRKMSEIEKDKCERNRSRMVVNCRLVGWK